MADKLAELLALNDVRMMPSHGRDSSRGHATRIGPAPRAPLASVFDLDEFLERMREMRGGHEFPPDALIPLINGIPINGGAGVSAGTAPLPEFPEGKVFRFGRPSAKTASEPGYLYHATNEENAVNMVGKGMKPHRPWHGTDQRAWPDGGVEKRVYFTPKAESAWQFAPEHGEPALLRVKADRVRARAEGTGDMFTRERVRTGDVEVMDADGKWHKLTAARERQALLDALEK